MLLTGPELLFKQFLPKHRLNVSEISPVLGIGKDALWKRIREGKCDLRLQKDEHGTIFITIQDLARYLYPDDMSFFPFPPAQVSPGRGRPRGAKNKPKAPSQLGGAR